MNKLIKKGNVVVVWMGDGRTFSKTGMTTGEYLDLSSNLDDDEYVLRFFNPGYDKEKERRELYDMMVSGVGDVPFLSYDRGRRSVYWPEVSPLSLPQDFAESVVKEYRRGGVKAVKAYRNFWTLLSLNPVERCRKKLWRFLHLHGFSVSSSGFFVTYRNAMSTGRRDSEGNPVYTDTHSRTTSISIGHMVSMPREACDCDVDKECSRGLHSASAKWLKRNYFGDVGLVCLVNPADVVSVPGESEYGKIRSTAYIPIDYVRWDEEGNVIPYDVKQGFECRYAAMAIYEGMVGSEKSSYVLEAPMVHGVSNDTSRVSGSLLALARECLMGKRYTVMEGGMPSHEDRRIRT